MLPDSDESTIVTDLLTENGVVVVAADSKSIDNIWFIQFNECVTNDIPSTDDYGHTHSMPFLQRALYDPSQMKVECSNNGDQGYKSFYWVYCTYCMNNVLPGVLDMCKQHLPESAKIEDLVAE